MAELATRLFLITPRIGAAAELVPGLAAVLEAGDVACLLLRLAPLAERSAKQIVKAVAPIVQDRGVALLVEDARLATHSGADGVHVTGAGEDLAAALGSLKPERIVGAGGLPDRDAAMEAGESGADYVMFGDRAEAEESAAATLERVAWWVEIFNVPCVGLARGLDEVEPLARTGTEFVGLGEALWQDPRGMAAMVAAAGDAVARGGAAYAAAVAEAAAR